MEDVVRVRVCVRKIGHRQILARVSAAISAAAPPYFVEEWRLPRRQRFRMARSGQGRRAKSRAYLARKGDRASSKKRKTRISDFNTIRLPTMPRSG